LAKLGALYDCKIMDCYDHPEYLKAVLEDVYKEDYRSVILQIRSYLGELEDDPEIIPFFKTMES
jgi:predicted alpha/beta-fold hydrolase